MLRFLGLLLAGMLLSGCAMSEDDRDFYYSGWINPNKRRNYDERGMTPQHPAGYYKADPLDQ